MKLSPRTLAVALALTPAIALAQNDTATKGDTSQQQMDDSRIASMLHQVNKMEIDAGKLAEKKGHSSGIKDFGRTLVKDHQQADKKLAQVAKEARLNLSDLTQVEKEKLRVDKEKMDQVKKMSGAEFDHTFAQVMYNGHDEVLKMLDDHAKDIRSSALKDFVDATRPKLEQHRDMAQKLEGSEKAMGRSPELRKRSDDTSSTNRRDGNPEGNRGDASPQSGPPIHR